jgi:hypothetical protein
VSTPGRLTPSDTIPTHPIPWRRRLHGHLSLARISNSPTVVSNVLAGAALAGGLGEMQLVVVLIVAMICFYTAGMYLNDVMDYTIDLQERPERPLPTGTVSRQAAMAVTAALLIGGVALLALASQAAFLSGLALVGLIILYDAWHKTNPFSPLLMAGTRVLVYVTVFFAFSTDPTLELVPWSVVLLLYMVALTFIAKRETSLGVMQYWPALILFLPALWALIDDFGIVTIVMVVAFVTWVAYSISFVYRTVGRSIGGAIARLIAGISLLDGLVLATVNAGAVLMIAIMAFALTLMLQRYVRGT